MLIAWRRREKRLCGGFMRLMAALARLMGLAQTEVYEVATFYHHFAVVKESRDGTLAAPAA